MKYIRSGKRPFQSASERVLRGKRFKVMCADAGLSLYDTAKILHVTPRTVYAWFSGRTAVPYSAYKLIRILGRYELPGTAWAGWSIHSGKLWSPEGYGFAPSDSLWWSLLCRQAQCFRAMYQRSGEFERQLMQLAAVGHFDLRQAVQPAGGAGVVTPAWPVQSGDPLDRAKVGRRGPTGGVGPAAPQARLNLSIRNNSTVTVAGGVQ